MLVSISLGQPDNACHLTAIIACRLASDGPQRQHPQDELPHCACAVEMVTLSERQVLRVPMEETHGERSAS